MAPPLPAKINSQTTRSEETPLECHLRFRWHLIGGDISKNGTPPFWKRACYGKDDLCRDSQTLIDILHLFRLYILTAYICTKLLQFIRFSLIWVFLRLWSKRRGVQCICAGEKKFVAQLLPQNIAALNISCTFHTQMHWQRLTKSIDWNVILVNTELHTPFSQHPFPSWSSGSRDSLSSWVSNVSAPK